ncbi:unnamed protein product [Hydatigera taeniaeformis]|uniref:Uncharacterized protein n=1 Tax=Hydatigena taeniaeformis TaxID=6205 RepID=A0A0R3XAM1_HYDTA|nr:unnamed protein product [Hydatigera taeniaeformis]
MQKHSPTASAAAAAAAAADSGYACLPQHYLPCSWVCVCRRSFAPEILVAVLLSGQSKL